MSDPKKPNYKKPCKNIKLQNFKTSILGKLIDCASLFMSKLRARQYNNSCGSIVDCVITFKHILKLLFKFFGG